MAQWEIDEENELYGQPIGTGQWEVDEEASTDLNYYTEPRGTGDFSAGNIMRGIGGRVTTLFGNLAGFAQTAGENLEESVAGLGGFAFMPGEALSEEKPGLKYLDADEWRQYKEQGGQMALRELQNIAAETDFGYKPSVTMQDWREAEGFFDSAGKLATLGLESGLVSLPDMAAAVLNAPAYFTSRSEEIAQERAHNSGREEPNANDLAWGSTTAAVVAAMEKFGAEKVMAAFTKGGNMPTRILTAALGEGATEFAQEEIEYSGETVGTDKPYVSTEATERGIVGMAGGMTVGGGVAAASAPFNMDFDVKPVEQNMDVVDDELAQYEARQVEQSRLQETEEFEAGLASGRMVDPQGMHWRHPKNAEAFKFNTGLSDEWQVVEEKPGAWALQRAAVEEQVQPTEEIAKPAETETVTETVTDSVSKPAAEKVVEKAAEPAVEPVVAPTVEPTVEQKVEKIAEPVVEPIAEPVTTEQVTTEPVAEPVAEPVTDIEQVAHEAATSPRNELPEPTEGQKEAGNYKKAHVRLDGLEYAIENPAGSKRRPEWPEIKHHYGYVKGTEAADGDQVDTFMNVESNKEEIVNDPVFIIDQQNKDGSFDEHKVMLGFKDQDQAVQGYLDNYTKDWRTPEHVSQVSYEEFKEWVRTGDTKSPYTMEAQPEVQPTEMPEPAPVEQPEVTAPVAPTIEPEQPELAPEAEVKPTYEKGKEPLYSRRRQKDGGINLEPDTKIAKAAIPSEKWLKDQRRVTTQAGRLASGAYREPGEVTAHYPEGYVYMPVSELAKIPGKMREQKKVRLDSLDWLSDNMLVQGKLPGDQTPFIEVQQDGKAWVEEGNHRIMAAEAAGWDYLPVDVRFFNGAERMSGDVSAEKIAKWHREAVDAGVTPETYGAVGEGKIQNRKIVESALSKTREKTITSKSLDQIDITFEDEDAVATNTAEYWMNDIDGRIKELNRLRDCV